MENLAYQLSDLSENEELLAAIVSNNKNSHIDNQIPKKKRSKTLEKRLDKT